MPEAVAYKFDDRAQREAGEKERADRQARIDLAMRYYYGDHPAMLKVSPNKPNLNVIFNLIGQCIDDVTSMVGTPRFEVAGGSEREPDAAGNLITTTTDDQMWLDAFWEDHDAAEFMSDLATSAAVAGHTFVRLYVDDETGQPRAALLHPASTVVYWSASDVRKAQFYRVRWSENGEQRMQDIVRGELLPEAGAGRWGIAEYVERKGGKWERVGFDVWDYPFAPIVDWKNRKRPHEYYGREDVSGNLNNVVNFVASNTNKIIRFHAHPLTVAQGVHLGETTRDPDQMIEVTDPEGKIYNVEMQSDLTSSLQFLQTVRQGFFSEQRVVDLSSIGDKLGQMTNFGVRMLFSRMIDNVSEKRRLHGKGLAELCRRALLMGGIDAGKVEVAWGEMLPMDRRELVDTVEKEIGLGLLSKQTATQVLGRDYDVERERMEEEEDRRVDGRVNEMIALGQRGLAGGAPGGVIAGDMGF